MKKVLIFHHCGDIGGAGISLLNTVSMLSEDFNVVTYTEMGPIMEKFVEKGFVIKAYRNSLGAISSYSGSPKVFSRTYIKKMMQIWISSQEIKEIIERENPHIIVTNSITTAYIAKIVKKNNWNIRVVSFIRETYRMDVGTKLNINYLSKYTDYIIYISQFDLEKYNIPVRNQAVIYNSIDVSNDTLRPMEKRIALEELNVKSNSFNVLYLGGDSSIKGWELMKEIIRRKSKGIHFLIAGKCEDKIFEDNVSYIGVQKQLRLCMTCANVLIFPVASPHQGRPIFEAGAYHLPVIVPNYSVFDEAVINNVNGLRYTPFSADDCLEKIRFLKDHPDMAVQMGNENYKKTTTKHSYKNNKSKMISIFASL